MVEVKRRMIISSIIDANGIKTYWVAMEPDYIEPIKNKSIRSSWHGSNKRGRLKIGDVVTSGTQYNFFRSEFMDIIDQIDEIARHAGLKDR